MTSPINTVGRHTQHFSVSAMHQILVLVFDFFVFFTVKKIICHKLKEGSADSANRHLSMMMKYDPSTQCCPNYENELLNSYQNL